MNDTKPSKSAKKRAYLALQHLGEQLIGLSDDQLDRIDLEQSLRDAVVDARTMTAHGALRRQRQLIGKMMRNIDPAPIRAALAEFGDQDRASKALFRRAEQWRDRIVADGRSAVAEFANEWECDISRLRALAAQLDDADNPATRKKIQRRIFRDIHEQLSSIVQKGAR